MLSSGFTGACKWPRRNTFERRILVSQQLMHAIIMVHKMQRLAMGAAAARRSSDVPHEEEEEGEENEEGGEDLERDQQTGPERTPLLLHARPINKDARFVIARACVRVVCACVRVSVSVWMVPRRFSSLHLSVYKGCWKAARESKQRRPYSIPPLLLLLPWRALFQLC